MVATRVVWCCYCYCSVLVQSPMDIAECEDVYRPSCFEKHEQVPPSSPIAPETTLAQALRQR